MVKTGLELAKVFFSKLNEIPEAQKEMKKLDHIILFKLEDDRSFYVEFKGGRFVSVKSGIVEPDIEKVLIVTSDTATLTKILEGKLRFADAVSTQKIQSGDMIKRPALSWIGKLIRIGQGIP